MPGGARRAAEPWWRRAICVAPHIRRRLIASAAAIGCGAPGATTLRAQAADSLPAPIVTPNWNPGQLHGQEPRLTLRLDRPLTARDGRLAILVGSTDLSSLLVLRGTDAHLSLRGESSAGGTVMVSVYLVRTDGTWMELGAFPLRRRTRAGFDTSSWHPRLDAQTDGQLGTGAPVGASAVRATPFQDLSWNGGFRTRLQRDGWTSELQALLVAMPRTSARLRSSQLGDRAPMIDLASYTLQIARGPVALSAGHLTLGRDRLLVNEFRSRGVSATVGLGRLAQLELASAAGSELVGWDDPLGVSRASHRVQSATLSLDAVPSQPGLVRAELSALTGALQPLPGFTQGAVTDREASRGVGGSVVAALPSQRARIAFGLAQSRFENPIDRLLSGDSPIIPVQASTKWARYAELTLEPLRQHQFAGTTASLQVVARHQRTDPLYRSVAASLQADQQQNAIELSGAIGLLQLQGGALTGRDNLAEVASLLVTRSDMHSLSASMPLAQLARIALLSRWLPTVSVTRQGTAQRGDALPDSAGFRFEAQRPDQRNSSTTLQLGWQRNRWNVALRANRSLVDNRQSERESSDFRTRATAITFGVTPTPSLSLALDLSDELQHRLERQSRARSQRAALQADWRPWRLTTIGGAWSVVRSDDPDATTRARNDEVRLELSQGLAILRRTAEGAPTRAFVRYTQAGASNRFGAQLQPMVRQWTLSAGFNARFL